MPYRTCATAFRPYRVTVSLFYCERACDKRKA